MDGVSKKDPPCLRAIIKTNKAISNDPKSDPQLSEAEVYGVISTFSTTL